MEHPVASRPSGARALRRLLALSLVFAAGTALFTGAWLVGSVAAGAAGQRPALPSDVGAAPPASTSRTDRAIGALQERLRRRPDDARGLSSLGLAYLQKGRETGDPGFYGRAEQALQEALARSPEDADTLVGLGTLAFARHDFAQALAWAERAVAAAPGSAAGHAALGDAQVELGRYDAAVVAIQRAVDLRPGQATYARVAYLRELHGDVPGAVAAMEGALVAGAAGAEATEWVRVQLGHLRFMTGDLEGAEHEYRTAATLLPGYVPARAGQARVAAARGEHEEAVRLYTEAAEAAPLPDLLVGLDDVYHAAGRASDEARLQAVLRAERELAAASGISPDIEGFLFDIDHDVDLPGTVARLRALMVERPSIRTADALAWGLYRLGACAEADIYARQALRLGTRDALLLFHAGRIAECTGDRPRARWLLEDALATNPAFSLRHAPVARAALARLADGQPGA